ncbi:MAG TPA: hypothetical protein DCX13_00605 [Rhodobacteraceae bacterium]|nr:hypothetical protein [Paracoccaceae bacterium]
MTEPKRPIRALRATQTEAEKDSLHRALLEHGQAALNAGDFMAARAVAAEVFAFAPGSIGALWLHVSAGPVNKDDPVFGRLESLAKTPGLAPEMAAQIAFMRGKALDDQRDYPAAFGAFCEANSLKPSEYDPIATRALADALIAADAQLPDAIRAPPFGPRLVFVLGMPRSGTSLMAQMLGAHRGAENLGECTALAPALARSDLPGNPHLAAITAATRQSLSAARATYLKAIGATGFPGQVLIDKMPENWWFAPLLPRIFPEAVIVHMRRPRLATAWSCFRNDFAQGHGYATRFPNILAQYETHLALCSAGQARARDGQWHEVGLDALAANPRSSLEPVLGALGLEWDEACLKPEVGGAMPTLSKWQVRQGIQPKIARGWQAYLPLISQKWGLTS